jgi:hypothetical protein
MKPSALPKNPTIEVGSWVLYLPGAVVDRVFDVNGSVITTEGGHTFWERPESFILLEPSEVDAYADAVSELTRVSGSFLGAARRGNMTSEMAMMLLRTALGAISKSLEAK